MRSHVEPLLALDEVGSAVLVADAPGPAVPKLRTVVPPRPLVWVLGRALAKLVVCLRIARKEHPDVVLAYNLVPHALNAAVVAKVAGIPSAFHMIGGPEEWLGGGWQSDNNVVGRMRRPNRLLERLFLRVIRRFDAVATMGSVGRRALIERGIDSGRIVELPAAVDTARFARADRAASPTYDVVSVTSLIPRKRPSDLLAVAARLHAERPGFRFAILGRGALLPQIREQARELGLGDAIDFVGFRDDPEEIVRRAAVFLLASRQEGLSIALSEAMAAGVPPVVTNVGETASLVVDGETGYLWPVGDVETATARVRELLDDDELRRRLGAAAARRVTEHAHFDRIVEGSRELLARALAQ